MVAAGCGSQLEPSEIVVVGQAASPAAGTPGVVGEASNGSGTPVPPTDAGGDAIPAPEQGPGGGAPEQNPGESNPGGGEPEQATPLGETKQGDCAGFKNTVGITDDTIVIGNASDISGPIPGLFQSSQDAVAAFVAYFNATSDICGRKLSLQRYDTRTDAAADQRSYVSACDETFATVGSMSAFDSGGATVAQGCGLPDIRTANVTAARSACSTCFGAQGTRSTEWPNAFADFVKTNYGSAAQRVGMVYIDAGGAAEAAKNEVAALTKRGLTFLSVEGIPISEFNYAPYVQQLKDEGVEAAFFVGAYQQSVRLRQAMQQQGYSPKVYFRDPTDYEPDFVSSGGEAVEGTVVAMNFVPFEEASSSQEMQLYLSWLQQSKPGAKPSFFGVYAWSAARLFVERAATLGGKLDRESLVSAFRSTNNWTANGLTAPQPVGGKHVGDCWRFLQLNDGKWSAVGGKKYLCQGLSVA
jgi:ABC-type branched-subunit amino acid transport system substrate-binding protein